jgi:hypothetical protein
MVGVTGVAVWRMHTVRGVYPPQCGGRRTMWVYGVMRACMQAVVVYVIYFNRGAAIIMHRNVE